MFRHNSETNQLSYQESQTHGIDPGDVITGIGASLLSIFLIVPFGYFTGWFVVLFGSNGNGSRWWVHPLLILGMIVLTFVVVVIGVSAGVAKYRRRTSGFAVRNKQSKESAPAGASTSSEKTQPNQDN